MHPCQICFTIFFGIVILVGVILFAISFSIVDLNTVALKRNTYNRKIEEKTVYKPGRLLIIKIIKYLLINIIII